jgi:hypothetical protein
MAQIQAVRFVDLESNYLLNIFKYSYLDNDQIDSHIHLNVYPQIHLFMYLILS